MGACFWRRCSLYFVCHSVAIEKTTSGYRSVTSALALRGLEAPLPRDQFLPVFYQKLKHDDGYLL
jgi:hypothetical protein